MSHYGPFETRVGVYQRYTNLMDLIVRNTRDAGAYRLRWAPSLDDAYGTLAGGGAGSGTAGAGTAALLDAEAGQIACTVPRAIVGPQTRVVENRKGQTSFQIDPQDIPVRDDVLFYARVQERRFSTGAWLTVAGAVNTGLPIEGPILVVPAPGFFSRGVGVYTLHGTAPSNTGCALGELPFIDETVQTPLPMHIVFPRPVSSLLIRNVDAAGHLLVSYGLGMPMIEVADGEELVTNYGHGLPAITELVVCRASGDGGCVFEIDAMTEHYSG